jgi:hypothetical protein
MICPKCNKNNQQFITTDNLAGLIEKAEESKDE